MSRSNTAATILGLGVAALVAVSGALDFRTATHTWSQMGPLPVGSEIPEFRVPMLEGEPLDRAGMQGQVTMLTFWATWCGACAEQMPAMVQLHEDHASEGLRIVGVNVDRAGAQAQMAREYRDAKELPFEIGLDSGRVGDLFRVTMLPHVVIFDRSGTLRTVHQGKVKTATLRREVEQLLAE